MIEYTFERCLDLADPDFDRLIRASLPYLDPATYNFPAMDLTEDEKVELVCERLAGIKRFLDAHESYAFFGYKMFRDGWLVGMFFGQVTPDHEYIGVIGALGYDEKGSKAWTHEPNQFDHLQAFMAEHGITQYKARLAPKNQHVKRLQTVWNRAPDGTERMPSGEDWLIYNLFDRGLRPVDPA